MTAYLIAAIEVEDPERYARYRDRVPALVEAAGGRYLVRGGRQDVVEGTWPGSRSVVMAFPDRDAALAFYRSAACQAIVPDRLAASEGSIIIVEGVDAS